MPSPCSCSSSVPCATLRWVCEAESCCYWASSPSCCRMNRAGGGWPLCFRSLPYFFLRPVVPVAPVCEVSTEGDYLPRLPTLSREGPFATYLSVSCGGCSSRCGPPAAPCIYYCQSWKSDWCRRSLLSNEC